MDTQPKETSELYSAKDRIGQFLSNCRTRAVLPYIKGEFVDLACGDNRFAALKPNGIGVDLKDYGQTDIICSDFSRLPFPDKSKDTVTIIASLNYFDDPHAVLNEVHRILKNDGQLIFTMPPSLLMLLWHKIREPWAKRHGFSKKELFALLSANRFSVAKTVPFLFFLNRLYVVTKI